MKNTKKQIRMELQNITDMATNDGSSILAAVKDAKTEETAILIGGNMMDILAMFGVATVKLHEKVQEMFNKNETYNEFIDNLLETFKDAYSDTEEDQKTWRA